MSEAEHERFMRLALDAARVAAAGGEVPVGSIVVKDGRVVATGHNLREANQDPTAHAELLAIRGAAEALGSWRLDGCTVYVTLEPCPMCAGAMVLARVERCVFGCRDPKGGFLGTLGDLSAHPGLNHSYEVVPGVLETECAEVLQAFFKDLRRRP
jgi:tRNA(adenine34) deaminase